MYMVYAQSGPARLGMRSAETFEEAREKADQTARELSDRLSAPYEEVRTCGTSIHIRLRKTKEQHHEISFIRASHSVL